MPHIYHITSRSEWETQKNASGFRAPSLESEGFIHSSRADQIVDTANRIFAGRHGLVILVIDPERLKSPLKVEDSYGHGSFPHVYGPIDTDAIVDVLAFPALADGSFELPGEIRKPEREQHDGSNDSSDHPDHFGKHDPIREIHTIS